MSGFSGQLLRNLFQPPQRGKPYPAPRLSREGRGLIERSLEANPRNAHGAHIYVHSLYENGGSRLGRDYLEGWLADYPPDAQLHCHLWWHVAMFELELGNPARVWEIYASRCSPQASRSMPINIVTDSAALLWRAELREKSAHRISGGRCASTPNARFRSR